MPVLYLTSQGAELHRAKNGLALVQGVETRPLPLMPFIERVMVMGQVTCTSRALDLLMGRSIPVTFCSVRGRYKGTLRPAVDGESRTRAVQVMAQHVEAVQREEARYVVLAKIEAQRAFLQERQRRTAKPEVRAALNTLSTVLQRVDGAPDVDALRGYEGAAAAAYYPALAVLSPSRFPFCGMRSRRPPKDPFNAMLSLCYMLLVAEASNALLAAGLDPAVGFLHTYRAGRPSLACDLMEPFRTRAGERFVFGAASKQQISHQEFDLQPDGGYRLPPDAFRRVLAGWEAFLEESLPAWMAPPTVAGCGTPGTLRAWMRAEALYLAQRLRARIPWPLKVDALPD